MTDRPADAAKAVSLAAINLCDLGNFAHGVPYDIFTTLRRDAPVFWQYEKEPWERGFWAITKHDDVAHVLSHHALFSAARNSQIKDGKPADYAKLPAQMIEDMMAGNFIQMDPPEHDDYRRIATPFSMPKMLQQQEQAIRARVEMLLKALPDRGDFDLVAMMSKDIPIFALCQLLGLPEADFPLLLDWSDRLAGASDPEFSDDIDGSIAAHLHPVTVGVMIEMIPYALDIYARRRAQPTGDMLSAFANGTVGGAPVSDAGLVGAFNLLIFAGNETTRNSFTGGMIALGEHPDQFRMLVADPTLIPNAVDEILRWTSPVIHFRRTATTDTEIRGQRIAKGDKVVVWFPSANRDEDVFERADEFDITRRDARKQIAFGRGVHMCLGQYLAKMELRIMLEEIVRHRPGLGLVGRPEYMRNNFVLGIKRVAFRCDA